MLVLGLERLNPMSFVPDLWLAPARLRAGSVSRNLPHGGVVEV